MNNKELLKHINKSIDEFVAGGGKLVTGAWGVNAKCEPDDDNSCRWSAKSKRGVYEQTEAGWRWTEKDVCEACALGTVLDGTCVVDDDYEAYEAVAHMFKKSDDWVEAFVSGFDNNELDPDNFKGPLRNKAIQNGYEMGKKVRARAIKKGYLKA